MSNSPPGIIKVFQFPVRRPAAVRSRSGIYTPEQPGDEATGETIQGIRIGSKEEWRVAVALSKRNIEYRYQVPIRGGRSVRGGQVIDFVLQIPFPQPLQVFGEYFHPGELNSEERFKLAIIHQIFGRPAIILWGSKLASQSQADAAIADIV